MFFQPKQFDVEKFIQAVKDRPAIYNSSHLDYYKKQKRIQLWDEIGAIMFPDWGNSDMRFKTEQEIFMKVKWKSLRDSFNREERLRKMIGTNSPHSKYEFYDKLSFLIRKRSPRIQRIVEPQKQIRVSVQRLNNVRTYGKTPSSEGSQQEQEPPIPLKNNTQNPKVNFLILSRPDQRISNSFKLQKTISEPPTPIVPSPIVTASPLIFSASSPLSSTSPLIISAPPPISTSSPLVISAPPPISTSSPLVISAPPPVSTAQHLIFTAPPPVSNAPPPVSNAPPSVSIAPSPSSTGLQRKLRIKTEDEINSEVHNGISEQCNPNPEEKTKGQGIFTQMLQTKQVKRSRESEDGDKLFLLSFVSDFKRLPWMTKYWIKMKFSEIMHQAILSLDRCYEPEETNNEEMEEIRECSPSPDVCICD